MDAFSVQRGLATAAVAEDLPYHPLVLRAGRIGTTSGIAVSKFLQYAVLAPPDNAVSVAKFLQYAVLSNPDNAVSVSKFVQYVVIEQQFSLEKPRPPILLNLIHQPDENEYTPLFQRRMVSPVPPPFVRAIVPPAAIRWLRTQLDENDCAPLFQRRFVTPPPSAPLPPATTRRAQVIIMG